MCRASASQLMRAGPAIHKKGARLIAILKEREGHEEFLADHWNTTGGLRKKWKESDEALGTPHPSPEMFFDTEPKDGQHYPLFRLINENSVALSSVMSGVFGGKVARSWKAASKKGFEGNLTVGEGSVPGGVLVLNGEGEILLHHKELSFGHHPSDEDLFDAISKL